MIYESRTIADVLKEHCDYTFPFAAEDCIESFLVAHLFTKETPETQNAILEKLLARIEDGPDIADVVDILWSHLPGGLDPGTSCPTLREFVQKRA